MDIFGSYLSNSLTGTNNDDLIVGWEGDDILMGNGGNDLLYGGAGNDELNGGEGNDKLFGDQNPPLTGPDIGIGSSGSSSNTGSVTGVAIIPAPPGDDILRGGAGNDSLYGGGNDQLFGESGDDYIKGQNISNDFLDGGTGNDFMEGGGGNDAYVVDSVGDVVSEVTGFIQTGPQRPIYDSVGIDTVSASISYTLGDYLENLILIGNSAINGYGNSLNNNITGNDANNRLSGRQGNDVINGGNGIDRLVESGNVDLFLTNTSLIGLGTDSLTSIEEASLTGGSSNNTLNATSFTGKVDLYGLDGNDYLYGGSGNDFLYGGNSNDYLDSGSGNDYLYGDDGDDYLDSGSGNDYLYGGNGNDSLNGSFGQDNLIGVGSENGVGTIDQLTGGTDADRFILGTSSFVSGNKIYYNDGNTSTAGVNDYALITDFNTAQDKIQLSGTVSNYRLGSSPVAGVVGTAIYYRPLISTVGSNFQNELIAIVQGSVGLNLGNSYFTYVNNGFSL